jgi:hypothetical protein
VWLAGDRFTLFFCRSLLALEVNQSGFQLIVDNQAGGVTVPL